MKKFLAFSAAVLCCAQAAHAADTLAAGPRAPIAPEPQRVLQVTPYLWATGLKGRISPFHNGPTIHTEKSFSDVLDDLDFGGFVNMWGRHGRFVYSGDVMYVDTRGADGAGPLPAMQIPGIGAPIPPGAEVTAKVRTKQFMSTLLGGYRVVDMPDFTLDALGGARFWHISNTVKVTAGIPPVGSRAASHGESFGWVDPVVGMRAFLRVTEKLSFQTQADIGGFGAGSDLTWSALATLNYTFTDRLSTSIGYKALKVDYDHGGHVYDTRLSGPVLGVTYRF
ncbi:hypothetical protein H0A73_13355 [Alcaligenaceae bacterium]|nr:hypothetical protein [Alcaligenaceae bacterium]